MSRKLTHRKGPHPCNACQRASRADLIEALGWEPEPEGVGSHHPDAYLASAGEMVRYLREDGKALPAPRPCFER